MRLVMGAFTKKGVARAAFVTERCLTDGGVFVDGWFGQSI